MVSRFVLTVLHFCDIWLDLLRGYVVVIHAMIDDISAPDSVVDVAVAVIDVLCMEGIRS